ncbi:MAG TPA: hypothetical protein VMW55_01045 [Nitrosopumilaceae archaeon]|nr:hypothetical protein [Nitrosopumilaceae archaeon]
MTFLRRGQNSSKELEFIQKISEKIDTKLAKSDKSLDSKIDKLSFEELQDLRKIVGLADFLLYKYEDKKDTKEILEHFVSIIHSSAESIEEVDDEVSELIISSEDSIHKIKELHVNISQKYDFEKPNIHAHNDEFKTSSHNLTKFPIEVNSQEYQQNSGNNKG